MKQTPAINIFDIRCPTSQGAVRKRELPKDKYDGSIPVKTLWGFLDEYIITGNDNGHLYCWDANNLDILYRNDTEHKNVINDMQVCIPLYFRSQTQQFLVVQRPIIVDHSFKRYNSKTV